MKLAASFDESVVIRITYFACRSPPHAFGFAENYHSVVTGTCACPRGRLAVKAAERLEPRFCRRSGAEKKPLSVFSQKFDVVRRRVQNVHRSNSDAARDGRSLTSSSPAPAAAAARAPAHSA